MEHLKVAKKRLIEWNYDAEADVLYLSIGKPRVAEGVDIGEGIIVRVDSKTKEIVGITIIDFIRRTLKELREGKSTEKNTQ